MCSGRRWGIGDDGSRGTGRAAFRFSREGCIPDTDYVSTASAPSQASLLPRVHAVRSICGSELAATDSQSLRGTELAREGCLPDCEDASDVPASSQASLLPQIHRVPVGASLLAKAACQAMKMLWMYRPPRDLRHAWSQNISRLGKCREDQYPLRHPDLAAYPARSRRSRNAHT